jgi:hypothetical protein
LGIDILVPALGRPQNIPPLMESLEVTSEPYRVIFICSPGDDEQIDACFKAAETRIAPWPAGRADFAKKINWAYGFTTAEWIFQAATDVKFHLGWDVAALSVAERTGKQVIGTNDLHNPQVKRGMQSTHTLFARSYIEEWGGTFDSTGKVFSTRYDHQYVDLEFCQTARQRDCWAFAKQSIVEHLHPHWGLAEHDETYEKATRQSLADRRLFQQRMGRPRTMTRADRRMRQRRAR